MATQHAILIDDRELGRILEYLRHNSPLFESDWVKVLLSRFAGMRVGEIAEVTVDAVTDANGEVGNSIRVIAKVSKAGRERTIPMHPDLRNAIIAYRKAHPEERYLAIGPRRTQLAPSTISWWLSNLYKKLGFEGCSSHSGRRSFIADLYRWAGTFGVSLREAHMVADYSRLETTDIEPSQNMVRMIASLGNTRHNDAEFAGGT